MTVPFREVGCLPSPGDNAAVAVRRIDAAAVEHRYEPRAQRSGMVGFQVSRGMLGVSM